MRCRGIILCSLSALFFTACSTTRILQEDEYRLMKNNVTIQGEKELRTSDISPYIKQQANSFFPFGINPFVSIYNWSDGSDKPLSRLWRKLGQAPIVFNPSLVESSCENIANHLEYLGYFNSSVIPHVETKGKTVTVDYEIIPGKRYRIDEIKYEIPSGELFRNEFYSDTSSSLIKRGNYLSENDLEKETSRGTSYFRRRGYYNFNKSRYSFVADTSTTPGKTVLSYRIDSDTVRYHIGEVTVSLSESLPFKDRILTELISVHPGDVYSENSVNNTYSRLSALRVFNSVSVDMTPTDTGIVNCNINLSESQVKGLKINLEASTNSTGLIGVSPQISFYHKNIFHGAEWLSLNFVGNFQSKINNPEIHSNETGVSASLSLPKFLGLPQKWFQGPYVPRTEFNATLNYQNRPEYERHIGSFSFGYSGNFRRTFNYQLYPVQLNYVKLTNIDEDFNATLERNPFMRYSYQDHFDAGIGGTMIYRTNNDIVPRTSYHYVRLGFDVSGNVIGLFKNVMAVSPDGEGLVFGVPYAQYARMEVSLGQTFRWGKENGQALALRLFAGTGYAYGNSSALPFEKQFYCGGSSSLRGWQARSVGPGDSPLNESFSIPSQTGDTKLEANIEYRFGMFWKLEGALFADVGNVWNISEMRGDFYKTLASDWGAGIRANLDFILLRLDAGFKMHDPSRDSASRWLTPGEWFHRDGFTVHFGIGYPF